MDGHDCTADDRATWWRKKGTKNMARSSMAIANLWFVVSSLLLTGAAGSALLTELVPALQINATVSSLGEAMENLQIYGVSYPAGRAGKDKIHVSWRLNETLLSADVYRQSHSVVFKLCFAPPSQQDRPWRKSNNNIAKDKSCQFAMEKRLYAASAAQASDSFDWPIERQIPRAAYFVRGYVVSAAGVKIAYGQSTDKTKTAHLFAVDPITGRTTGMYIAGGALSFTGLGVLVSFFIFEKAIKKQK